MSESNQSQDINCNNDNGNVNGNGNAIDNDNESDTSEFNPMLACMSQMMQQQQHSMANVLSLFFTNGEQNICQILTDIKQSIDNNTACLNKIHQVHLNKS